MIVEKVTKRNKSIAFRIDADVIDEFRALAKELGVNQALTMQEVLINMIKEMKDKKNERK